MKRTPQPPAIGAAGWTKRALALGAESKQAFKIRLDSWVNALTGLGTSRDKTTSTLPTPDVILPPLFLEILYHSDDIAARIVSAIPDECFREPWQIVNKSNDDDRAEEIRDEASELESDFAALGVVEKFHEAMVWGRLYGLGAILIGVEEEPHWNPQTQSMEEIPPWEPLDWQRVRGLKYLTVLDKRDLTPWRWYADDRAPKFGDVALYMVQPVGVFVGAPYDLTSTSEMLLVHESRLVRFGGELTSKRERLRNQGADYSVLQKCFRALQLTNNNWQSAASLLADASQGVFTIRGLIDMIAQQPDVMQTRMGLVDLMRSTFRAIILDAGDGTAGSAEKFERVPTPFAGIPDMLDQTWNRLAAAARMPKNVLMGSSKTGLNTDDSDMRTWYDQVGASTRKIVVPAADRVLRIAAVARGYQDPERWTVKPGALWQMKQSERADYELKVAQRDHIYIDDGVWQAEEVALNRTGPNGEFSERTTIDMDARKRILDFKMALEEANAKNPPPVQTRPRLPLARGATQPAKEQGTPDTPDPGPPSRADGVFDEDLPWDLRVDTEHAPAGSPEGGQFVSSGAGAAGGDLKSHSASQLHERLTALTKEGHGRDHPEVKAIAEEAKRRGATTPKMLREAAEREQFVAKVGVKTPEHEAAEKAHVEAKAQLAQTEIEYKAARAEHEAGPKTQEAWMKFRQTEEKFERHEKAWGKTHGAVAEHERARRKRIARAERDPIGLGKF